MTKDKEAWMHSKNNLQQHREQLTNAALGFPLPEPLEEAIAQAADWLLSVEGADSEDEDKISAAWSLLNSLTKEGKR